MMGKGLIPVTLLLVAGFIQQAQPPTFRTSASIVPIDVRVIDKNGKAVTDLTKADFTVTEDGVPQTITQFEKDTNDHPAHPRWIVIVLGEGRIQAPFKSIDALEDMIRNSLATADRIGVIAYNRWSEFSADHTATVRLLERYKASNDRIQTDLETYNSGLRRQSGNGLVIEDSLQTEIDAIFREAPGQAIREFAPPSQMGRMSPGFEERTRFSPGRFSDLLHLYGAIDYLRTPEGDKHIILVVEQETPYGRARPSRIATTAEDLRIALHIVQTGGFGKQSTVTTPPPSRRSAGVVHPPTSIAADFNTSRSAHDVTEDTGGLAFSYTDPRKAFEKIGEAIRVDYLVGYIPTNEHWHGEYRHIDVHVNRPGVTAIYRRGYDAAVTLAPWNDRDTMTDVRLAEARAAVRPLRDLNLILKTSRTPGPKMSVELQIEPSQVAFAAAEGHHVASLDVAVWIIDRQGETIETMTDQILLRLTDGEYDKLVRQDIVYARSVPVTRISFEVRVGVYDYDNDRVGSATKRVQ